MGEVTNCGGGAHGAGGGECGEQVWQAPLNTGDDGGGGAMQLPLHGLEAPNAGDDGGGGDMQPPLHGLEAPNAGDDGGAAIALHG